MADKDFPSGPWTGFYQYRDGQRGQQDLHLIFQSGRMIGSGADELGLFSIEGSYNQSSKDVSWLKSYPNGHSIVYRGFREGSLPGIWGTWTIGHDWSGGFHIWPTGSEDECTEIELEVTLPLGTIQTSPAPRQIPIGV